MTTRQIISSSVLSIRVTASRSWSSNNRRDPRVANVKVLGGVFNRPLMLGVPQIVSQAVEATKHLPPDEQYAALTATAAQVMNEMPPRESPRISKSLDSVHASGPLGRAHCVIHGNSNYKQIQPPSNTSTPDPLSTCPCQDSRQMATQAPSR